ncbi:MAG: ATP-binding protein [Treponema sp.]|nr:ATP-binding protein [Candidatus Treponema equifaecale]
MADIKFKRKFYEEMLDWKNTSNGSSALMIDGARRIGKSTLAETFAQNEYDDYLIIDFAIASKEVKDNFENIGKLDVFFRNLFLFTGKELKPGRCVIIFDEVQKFPLARQSIKYLVKDGRYDYIETGSLISIKKKSQEILIPSEEDKRKMYPMDFEEFLWATGDKVTSSFIKECFEKRQPVGEQLHRKFMNTFRTYFAVGGMPQAICAFVEGKTYKQIDSIKRNILALYEEDLKKYDEDNTEKASAIFKSIPEQLSNHNCKFIFSEINKNARYKNYVQAVRCIDESMIGNYCRNVTNPELTLDLFAESGNFKLFMGDTGLLITQILKGSGETADDLYKKIVLGKLSTNLGMIFENMVAQMLRAKGYELFFHEYNYKPDGNEKEQKYEIDFLIVKDNHICPIEVKSSAYKKHESFDYFVKKYQSKKHERFIIYTKDLEIEDDITYLPIYMTMFL